jgi:phospholipid/cholesterol/gamma-HCH transport system substrate-binding protein
MSRESYDFWVGIFVIIGLASLFYLTFTVSGYRPNNQVTYYDVSGEFDNIGGLKLNAPVKSAGVTVGYVKSIRLDKENYMASVVLALRSDFQFPEDSTLSVLTSGLLGEQYIGIEAGVEDTMLANGGTIMKTQSAIVLEKLIGQLLVSFATKDN